jgi:hypothetical protein
MNTPTPDTGDASMWITNLITQDVNPTRVNEIRRSLLRMFPVNPDEPVALRSDAGVLWRMLPQRNGTVVISTVSRRRPDPTAVGRGLAPLRLTIDEMVHQRVVPDFTGHFSGTVAVHPMRRLRIGDTPVDLKDPLDVEDFVSTLLEKAGFVPDGEPETETGFPVLIEHNKIDRKITPLIIRLRGRFESVEAGLAAWSNGIGRSKGWGFGLVMSDGETPRMLHR